MVSNIIFLLLTIGAGTFFALNIRKIIQNIRSETF